ncbi:MAG: prolipoprotein diacylglyceryl transferase [Bdellovibrionales bacterium]|nr:prolipoprotein diacylglyceryl transferase [Bdellovibrionales bacterium]
MIPYFEITGFSIFGYWIDTFDLTLALAWFVGIHLVLLKAQVFQISEKQVLDLILLCLIFGFVGAHGFHLLFYYPDVLMSRPIEIFYVWSGLSSTGGFVGAGLACTVYLKHRRIEILPVADVMIFGLIPALFIGRIGCFLSHDHLGTLSQFPLAMKFPGGARHDLGGYEMLLLLLMSMVMFVFHKKRWDLQVSHGIPFSLWMAIYAVSRFFLDYLRARDLPMSDTRYGGLTPAQYICIVFLCISISVIISLYRGRKRDYKNTVS